MKRREFIAGLAGAAASAALPVALLDQQPEFASGGIIPAGEVTIEYVRDGSWVGMAHAEQISRSQVLEDFDGIVRSLCTTGFAS